MLGVGAALLLSTAAGLYWGLGVSRRAARQMVDWELEGPSSPGTEMSQELDRLMTELWKMESLERVPTR
ncbi:MAG TPA: hypothetical protein EYQ64_15125 [Gemmatimonadetes bacterium]|nr:hypothetical protein [Gemmatimonadota bacterium]